MPRRKTLERKSKYKGPLLPTGSALLNCACSDTPFGAFPTGSYINLVGDSHTGKTILALSILAEAYYHRFFSKYDLIYDDSEHANRFDLDYLFGTGFSDALQPPSLDDDGMPFHSEMIEDFHAHIMDRIVMNRPFIYVLDSLDSLGAEADEKKINEMLEARRRGIKPKGSYGMAKPKKSSELLRSVCGKIEKTNSILIIISQTRDNINPMAFKKKTKSGGTAWKFFMAYEIWLNDGGKITNKKEKEIIGSKVKAKVEKNKLTGKVKEILFDVYYDYGIDDMNACIDFLVEQGYWNKKKLTITSDHLNISGVQKKLIELIEENNLERKLYREVGKAWQAKEERLKLNRKPKYR